MGKVGSNKMNLGRMTKLKVTGSQEKYVSSVAHALALVLVAGFPAASWADQVFAPPPPSPTKVMDSNGINLISASPSPHMPSISTAGLSNDMGSLGITYIGNVTDFNDSFSGYIADRDHNPAASNNTGNTPIVIGQKSFQLGVDIFAGDCASSICTYWDKEGVAYLFDTTKTSEDFDGIARKQGVLVQINRPDGEIIKITLIKASSVFATSGGSNNNQYTVHQIATYYPSVVVSSNGWMEKYEYTTRTFQLSASGNSYIGYFPQKTYIINTSVDYCDPSAASCTSSNATHWPTWNITYPYMFKDVSGELIGNFGPEGYSLPSGLGRSYSFDISTHRVKDAYIPGRHTSYDYNWVDGSEGAAPYIITATKPNGKTYSTSADGAEYQFSQYGISTLVRLFFFVHQPDSFTDENGHVTRYEYNNDDTAYRADNRSLKRVISPEATYSGSTLTGGYTEYSYDGRRNVTSVVVYPKGGGAALISYYSYETTCSSATYIYCNKLKTYTDPNGYVTTYTYSPVHGQVLTETGPTGVDGVHTQKRYTYTAYYAKSLNSSGMLVPAATPVYRLTKVSSCRSATSADPAACATNQESVTEYAYDTSNLLMTKETVRAGDADINQPASATNVWQSTTYTYDDVGNRTSVDGPLPGTIDQTFTVYDVRRRPVYEIGADPDGSGSLPSVAVHHMYDADGREYRTETGTGAASSLTACSATATTCSAFTVTSYVERTYDPTSGLEVKSITATP